MGKWIVNYTDNESPDEQTASFSSKKDADLWILNQRHHSRYDANRFEVVDGPYDESKPRKQYPKKPVRKLKLWIDKIRPAPKGYQWIRSVMDLKFTDFYAGLGDMFLVDIDAGIDDDGKDLVDDGLLYIAGKVDRPVYVRFHGKSWKDKMRVDDAIKEYGWRHAYDSLHEDLDEDDSSNGLSFMGLRRFASSVDMHELAANVTNAMFAFLSDALDLNLPKLQAENAKLFSKIADKLESEGQVIPLFAVHYPSTDVNVLFVNDLPLPKKFSYKSFVKSAFRFAKQSLHPSISITAIPFKLKDDKISLDRRDIAYLQCAMTLLLSDIQFDALWPVKGDISYVMKYLDYICPSVMDAIGCLTFGGASIAARAAKVGAKTAAKKGAKTIAKNEMKLLAKLQAKAPKSIKKKIAKAKKMSKLSRQMKSGIKDKIQDDSYMSEDDTSSAEGISQQSMQKKDISFPEEELQDLSRRKHVVTHRVSDDFGKFNEGDVVMTPWGIPYRVSSKQLIDDISQSPYVRQLTQQQINFLKDYSQIAVIELDAVYEPPYTLAQIKANYPEKIYKKLASCPIHSWRAKTGIELIHQEPDEEELGRIWKNWQLMPQKLKDISDKKSLEMFGMTNAEHYKQLKLQYRKHR